MKCLLCVHYDVVNFECAHLAKKLGLEHPIQVDPTWGCKEYSNAIKDKDISSLKVDISIKM